MIYWVSYVLIKAFGKVFFPFTLRHRERIPKTGGFVFASNHESNIDPLLLGLCVRRKISYMAKKSLFRSPLADFFLRHVGAFPVVRERPDIGAMREAIKRLRAGSPLVVFPEGGRAGVSARGGKAGVGFLAVKSGCPVVPVFIEGSGRVLPPGARWFRKGRITITIGEPLSFARGESYETAAERVMRAIRELGSPPPRSHSS